MSTGPVYKTIIEVISGNGGNGCISFRREKRIAKGGPDGGNGGKGGSIFLQGDSNMLTLSIFKNKRFWKAGNGRDGSSVNKTGESSTDVVIKVPYGTEVWQDSSLMHDITSSQLYKVAEGGVGGFGNARFAAPDLTTPYISTKGEKGEHKNLTLILKYMADVGVIGLPNAGKSTLVHKLSRAKVRIGDYPFSTLEPVIGVAEYQGKKIVFADLPGLLEGAHNNIGLGHEFLQHLNRCKVLLHLIDCSSDDLEKDFNIIRNEINLYSPDLLQKTYLVCLTKTDLIPKIRLQQRLKLFNKYNPTAISELELGSIQALMSVIYAHIKPL